MNSRVLKHSQIDENSHRLIATPLLWYCHVTQTPVVTSVWLIVMRTFPSVWCESSHRRRVDYHSLIIDNYSRRFHRLAYKKKVIVVYVDGLVLDRRNSSALAMELRLSCASPSMYDYESLIEYQSINRSYLGPLLQTEIS